MDRGIRKFIKGVEKLEYPLSQKCELTLEIIYAVYCGSKKATYNKFPSNKLSDLTASNSSIELLYNELSKLSLSKKQLKELSNNCAEKFNIRDKVNTEVYDLVIKLLDLKNDDILLQINAAREDFILKADETLDSNLLKIRSLILPDNAVAENNIKLRLALTDINVTFLEDVIKIKKFKPTKVLINPPYNSIDKDYEFSLKSSNKFRKEIITIRESLNENSKMIAIVPNTMLSNSLYKEDKKILLEKYLEGIISLPLRYFSKTLNTEVSLLIIGKGKERVKVCDINKLFSKDDVKEAKLSDITDYIYDEYNENYKLVSITDIINKDSNLLISNIVTEGLYSGLNNLNTLSNVATIKKGSKKTAVDFKDYIDQTSKSKYCLLRNADIENGNINYDQLIRVIYDYQFEKFIVNNGDVVITNKCSTPKVALIETNDLKIIPTGSMIIISPNQLVLNGTYLKMYFESDSGKRILSTAKRGQKTLTLYSDDIKKLKIPVIPYSKQQILAERYKEKNNQLKTKLSEIELLKKQIGELINEGVNKYGNE